MTVTLRQETADGTTTKGSALTYAELDNNFIHLLRQGSVTVRGDSGTDQTLGEADKDSILQIAGGTNVTTALSSDSAGETVVTINATAPTPDFVEGVLAGSNISITSDSTGQITVNLADTPTFTSYKETVFVLSTDSAGAINVDPTDGPIQEITLNENVTFTGFQNAADGQSVTLILKQDGTGSRTFTESLDSAGRMLFAGGTSTLSTAANAIDVMSIVYAGGIYYASLSTNFS